MRQAGIVLAFLSLVIAFCNAASGTAVYENMEKYMQGAAQDSADADSTETKKRMFTVTTNYGSTTSFFGRNTGILYPYFAAGLSYQGKSGFWISSKGYKFLNTSGGSMTADLSTGWDISFSKRLDASVYYSKYFMNPSNPTLKSATRNLTNLSLGLDWKYIYSVASFSYIFWNTSDYFITLDNSRYFEKNKLFTKSDNIAFEPKFSIVAGTQNFASTYIETKVKGKGNGNTGFNSNGNNKGKGSGTGAYQASTVINTGPESSKFKILNYSITLPITYSIGDFSVEFAWKYNIPVNLLSSDPSKSQSIYTVALFYTFK